MRRALSCCYKDYTRALTGRLVLRRSIMRDTILCTMRLPSSPLIGSSWSKETTYSTTTRPDLVRSLLDEVWYVDAPRGVIAQRLLERHMRAGRSREEAEKKIASSDIPNVRIIERTRPRADRIIEPSNIP